MMPKHKKKLYFPFKPQIKNEKKISFTLISINITKQKFLLLLINLWNTRKSIFILFIWNLFRTNERKCNLLNEKF